MANLGKSHPEFPSKKDLSQQLGSWESCSGGSFQLSFFFALEIASTAEVPHWGGDFTGLAAISGDWLSKA